jgi:hypothetical protein
MEKINLENKILEALNKEDLKPISRWKFLLHEYFLYCLIFISLLALTISFGALFFIFDNLDFTNSRFISENVFIFIWRFLPIFWIVVSFVGLYLVKIFWDKTKKGYKWKGENVVAFSVLLGFIFGLSLHIFLDAGRSFDEEAVKIMPMHRSFSQQERELWLKRDEGRIFGKILENYSEKILLEERDGKTELVYFSKGYIPGKDRVATDSMIKVIGYKDSDNFIACAILPGRPPTFIKKYFNRDQNRIEEIKENSDEVTEKCKEFFPILSKN